MAAEFIAWWLWGGEREDWVADGASPWMQLVWLRAKAGWFYPYFWVRRHGWRGAQ